MRFSNIDLFLINSSTTVHVDQLLLWIIFHWSSSLIHFVWWCHFVWQVFIWIDTSYSICLLDLARLTDSVVVYITYGSLDTIILLILYSIKTVWIKVSIIYQSFASNCKVIECGWLLLLIVELKWVLISWTNHTTIYCSLNLVCKLTLRFLIDILANILWLSELCSINNGLLIASRNICVIVLHRFSIQVILKIILPI